jgi:FKBP-type peptidyl-prolyl cis-trans isomerase FkpA
MAFCFYRIRILVSVKVTNSDSKYKQESDINFSFCLKTISWLKTLFLPPKILQMKSTFFKSLFALATIVIFLSVSSCNKKDDKTTYDKDKATIEQYAADNQLNGQFTDSGLYYVIEKPGTANHPTINSNITISYNGYYLNGTVFDKSDFITFPLSNLIRGWQEGIPLVGEGGKIKLVIPSYLAYNDGVRVFDVTLFYFSK